MIVIALIPVGLILLGCVLQTAAQQHPEGFPDVPRGSSASKAVTNMRREGLLIGYPDGTFDGKTAPAEDNRVVAAALADLAQGNGTRSHTREHPVRFDIRSCKYRLAEYDLDQILEKDSPNDGPNISLQAVSELKTAFMKRNHSRKAFRGFLPPLDTITLVDSSKPHRRTKSGDAIGRFLMESPVTAWIPSYSVEGRYALVVFTVPWSIHGAEVACLLESVDGEWKVIWHRVQWFP